jgi:ketosteroid isomerase-like protein
MDSANVNVVRSIFAAWGRGDFSSTNWADPEIEYVFADGPAPGTWKGLAAMQEASRDWVSAWEDWRAEAESYEQLDDERVFVLMSYAGRGKASGLDLGEMHAGAASLWQVRAGRVTRVVCWWDRAHALAELGRE